MNIIDLNTTADLSNGNRHVQLLIDGNDCGVLYLSPKEYEALDRIIVAGDQSGVCVYRPEFNTDE